jgi:peptidyl-prolyl cis-trans isomerase B (cyclophilin B)
VASRKERQKERQRKLARQRLARRESRRAQRDRRIRQWTISILAAVAVIAVGGATVFFVNHASSSNAAAQATLTPSATHSATHSASATPTPSPTPSAVAEPARHCTYTSSPPAARKVGVPPAKPDYQATYSATIHTNRGDIGISLLNSKATCTVNSFVYLAAQKFFNQTSCHRLTTTGIFVLQCGDPTGTGSGGPGYKFADENLKGATYKAATVAMANSGPGTNGSQFFLVYKSSSLSPNYTPFGTITSGLNIILNVAKAGSDNSNASGDGHPKKKVVIERVTIKKT